MSDNLLAFIMFLIISFSVFFGIMIGYNSTTKSWQKWLVREGYATYEPNEHGGSSWKMIPKAEPELASEKPQILELHGARR